MPTPNTTTTTIEKFYSDISFTKTETQLLSSKFLDFGQIWNLSLSLIKHNFKRGFLFPTLWQVAVFAAGFAVVLAASFGQAASTVLPPYLEIAGENWEGLALFGQIFLLALLVFLVCAVVSSLIAIRQIYILNHKSIPSIWQTDRGFYIELLKLIGVGILYILVIIVISFIFDSFDSEGSIARLMVNLLQIGFFGLFGLYSTLIVLENQDMFDSLQTSLTLMKPIFWKNILRWLIFNLINVGVTILFVFVVGLAFVASSGAALMSFSAVNQSYQGTSAVIILMLGLLGLAVSIALSILQTAFNYTSFINIRLSNSKDQVKEMVQSELETNTKPAEPNLDLPISEEPAAVVEVV